MSTPRRLTSVPRPGKRDDDYSCRVAAQAVIEGTAHGVLQAVNTFEHHQGVVRGDRAERNGLKTITGDWGQLDRRTWRTLHGVLAPA